MAPTIQIGISPSKPKLDKSGTLFGETAAVWMRRSLRWTQRRRHAASEIANSIPYFRDALVLGAAAAELARDGGFGLLDPRL